MFETPAGSGCYHLGRIAVERDYRKQHIGSLVLKKLEEKARELGARELQLSAQVQARDFMRKTVTRPLAPLIPMSMFPTFL